MFRFIRFSTFLLILCRLLSEMHIAQEILQFHSPCAQNLTNDRHKINYVVQHCVNETSTDRLDLHQIISHMILQNDYRQGCQLLSPGVVLVNDDPNAGSWEE